MLVSSFLYPFSIVFFIPTNRVITTPTELIKIRQQDQFVRTSTSQIALKIFKESGVPGLYRGMTVTILRDIGYGAYFVGVRLANLKSCCHF